MNEADIRSLFLDCSLSNPDGQIVTVRVKKSPSGIETAGSDVPIELTIIDGKLHIIADLERALAAAA